jgi:malate/lactate dehydrogenase
MRIILLFPILLSLIANGQTKIFDLNKLDSVNFTNFISDKKVIVVGEMHGTTEVPLFVLSRPEIGLHELTCKQDEKSEKNRSRTGSDNC